jgi:hypothetical protein
LKTAAAKNGRSKNGGNLKSNMTVR